MPKLVQGVQGVVQGLCRVESPAVRGLCRVCRVSLYVCARTEKNKNITNKKVLSRVYIPPAHPAHPAQPASLAAYSCAGYLKHPAQHPAHPLLIIICVKNMEEKDKEIICGPENAKEFNALLREHMPEFVPLVKELYQQGLISGLRGAKITINPTGTGEKEKSPAVVKKTGHVCKQCQHFKTDTVGDGTGLGECMENQQPWLLIWPNTESCDEFKEMV